MELHCLRIWTGILIFNCMVLVAVGDTRYECIVNLMSRGEGGEGGGFGRGFGGFGGFGGYGGAFEADEFENEIGEVDEAEEGGMGAAMRATGSLTCPQGNRGHILVKRVAYGTSMFGSTCRSDGYCKEEYDPADGVATRCDGKSSCFIDMLQPVFLKCGRMSTYMLVEYECVDSWTTFDVCETISTVARGSSVFMTSPGYLTATTQKVTTGRQMCECILQSQNGADIYMDYLQTQLASEGDVCPYEYVMVESKKNITAQTVDKAIEVCGRRHVGARWFQGSIRLTYAAGGQMQKRGMIAKFTADNIGTAPRIELECGSVDASRLTLKERPATAVSPLPRRPMGPMMPPFPQYPPMNYPPFQPGGLFPTHFPGINGSVMPPLMPSILPSLFGQPDFSNWKINLPPAGAAPAPVDPSNAPQPPASLVPAPTSPPKGKRKPAVRRGGRGPKGGGKGPNKKNRAGKVVDDGQFINNEDMPATKEDIKISAKSGNGGMVGLVFGGIGAFLILGSVGILAINNYRKRKRVKREEAEYYYGRSASSTYGQGWKRDGDDNESVYATVAEVETYRQGCVNPAVDLSQDATCVNPVKQLDRSKGKGKGKGKGKALKEQSVYDEPEVRPSCSKEETTKPVSEVKSKVAVIEVHNVPDEYIAVTYGNDLHSEECIADNSYTSAKRNETNGCSECNITRPPRRRDSDYDNNVGVKKSFK